MARADYEGHEVARWEMLRRSLPETQAEKMTEDMFRSQVVGLLTELLRRVNAIEQELRN